LILADLESVFSRPVAVQPDEPTPAPVADTSRRWHGFSLADLLALAGPDEAPILRDNATVAEAFAKCLKLAETRARGVRPAHYTRAAVCLGCGPVWLSPGGLARVLGCPWCSNRAEGRPIPRPPVTCADCRHFSPNPSSPTVGVGTCAAGPNGADAGPPPRPAIKRICAAWRPNDDFEMRNEK
jgi:hypothetical protein